MKTEIQKVYVLRLSEEELRLLCSALDFAVSGAQGISQGQFEEMGLKLDNLLDKDEVTSD